MSKVKKAKVAKQPRTITVDVTPINAFSPKTAQEAIRPAFRAKPSYQRLIFVTPRGRINVGREANKGATAKWFLQDEHNKGFEGTKEAVRLEVGERISMAHRIK